MSAAPLFPASVVGSLPRPQHVRELIEKPTWDAADERAMDAAVRYAVSLQEMAGLDVVTDGEWRRRSYIGVIAELAHGFTLEVNPADGRPWTVVTEKLAPKQAGFIAREATFLKERRARRHQDHAARARPARRAAVARGALAQGLSAARRLRARLRGAAAARDRADPRQSASTSCRSTIRTCACSSIPTCAAATTIPDRAADFAVDMINALVDGFSGIKFAVHLCRRAGARVRGEKHHAGTYGPILTQLNRLKVQHLTMEFTAAGADDLESLGRLREDFELGLGVVDVTPGTKEDAQPIVARVERALQRVDAKRITLNPDCGFAPGSAAKVDIDEVYLKLRAEVEAARMLRARHG